MFLLVVLSSLLLINPVNGCDMSFVPVEETLILTPGHSVSVLCDSQCLAYKGAREVTWSRDTPTRGDIRKLYTVSSPHYLVSQLKFQQAGPDMAGTYSCYVLFNNRKLHRKSLLVTFPGVNPDIILPNETRSHTRDLNEHRGRRSYCPFNLNPYVVMSTVYFHCRYRQDIDDYHFPRFGEQELMLRYILRQSQLENKEQTTTYVPKQSNDWTTRQGTKQSNDWTPRQGTKQSNDWTPRQGTKQSNDWTTRQGTKQNIEWTTFHLLNLSNIQTTNIDENIKGSGESSGDSIELPESGKHFILQDTADKTNVNPNNKVSVNNIIFGSADLETRSLVAEYETKQENKHQDFMNRNELDTIPISLRNSQQPVNNADFRINNEENGNIAYIIEQEQKSQNIQVESSGELEVNIESSGELEVNIESNGELDNIESSGELEDNIESSGELEVNIESSGELEVNIESSSRLNDNIESIGDIAIKTSSQNDRDFKFKAGDEKTEIISKDSDIRVDSNRLEENNKIENVHFNHKSRRKRNNDNNDTKKFTAIDTTTKAVLSSTDFFNTLDNEMSTTDFGNFMSDSTIDPTVSEILSKQEPTTTMSTFTKHDSTKTTSVSDTNPTGEDNDGQVEICPKSYFGEYGVLAFAISLSLNFLLIYAVLMMIFMPRLLAKRRSRNKHNVESSIYKKKFSDVDEVAPLTLMSDVTVNEIDLGNGDGEKDLDSPLPHHIETSEGKKEDEKNSTVSSFLLLQSTTSANAVKPQGENRTNEGVTESSVESKTTTSVTVEDKSLASTLEGGSESKSDNTLAAGPVTDLPGVQDGPPQSPLAVNLYVDIPVIPLIEISTVKDTVDV